MPDTAQALTELREAERRMAGALKLVGMARGQHGYIAPAVADALASIRTAISNLDPAPSKRRGWPRLARTA